jgi:hypothetical protein
MATRLLAGVVAGLAVWTTAAHARVEHTARELVERYDRGDVDRVAALLGERHDAVGDFADDLRKMAAGWLEGQTPAVAAHRRLVVATVALEAAHNMPPHPNTKRMTETQWGARVQLLEWACDLLRTSGASPGAAERAWALASLALFEQGSGYPYYAYDDLWSSGSKHVEHLKTWLPNDSRWALADAIFAEQAAGLVGYPLDELPNDPSTPPRYDVHVRETPESVDLVLNDLVPNRPKAPPFPTDRKNFRVPLRAAVRAYGALRSDKVVGAEADLHLGAIEVALDQPTAAYTHLTEAESRLTDPVLLYAAHFFRASALTRLGQVQAAQIAFRQALDVMPHAESATVGLAWLLSLNQHHHEASEVAAASLAASAADKTSLDPIAGYPLGDAHLWGGDIAALRRAIAAPSGPGGQR